MKTLLTLTLMLLMAGSACAQFDNSIGIFFVDSGFDDPNDARANTNFDPAGAPFNAHICVVATTVFSVAAYEVGIEISDPKLWILSVTGPNGWTNFGSDTNHLVGYMTPVPSSYGYAVLATMQLLYEGTEAVNLFMGPATPSSVQGVGPAIVNGADVEDVYVCNYTGWTNLVATLNGDGIEFQSTAATEARSLSSVRALFN